MQKMCCVEGCDKPAYRSGMCNAHRLRAKRHGNPDGGRRSPGTNHCGKGFCPAAKKVWGHIHYLNNAELYKAKSSRWREENPEAYRDKVKNYLSRGDVQERARARTKIWAAENRDRKRQSDLDFKANNPAKITSYKARYRAARRQATPAWLTKAQVAQIEAVYKEARALTEQTGTPHEVDHIVPLAGRVVCGLHIPWNLRAIPKIANNRRPRIYQGDNAVLDPMISLDVGAEEAA
jgi:hypothetical protein